MIRVRLPQGKSIADLVDEKYPNWRGKNAVWDEKSSPWSDIKAVFGKLQYGKCAYCERPLQAHADEDKYDTDIEHFRPKQKVTAWGGLAAGRLDGYAWLATEVQNYLLACKACNSGQKKNHFPISGKAGRKNASIATLNAQEQPLLLNPLDATDPDPEDLIDWLGFTPLAKIPASRNALLHQRGVVLIEFFALERRYGVRRGCAEQIRKVWNAFKLQADPEDGAVHRAFLQRCVQENSEPHAACTRAFLRLIAVDVRQAHLEFLKAEKYLAELPDLYED
jgi:hypothetical protein